MQCYSNYAGSADKEYKDNDRAKNERNVKKFVKKYGKTTGLKPDVYNGAPGLRSVTYNNLDWLIQWQRKAIIVEGYTGMNFLGVDLGI
jgi:GH25 family lysozyme M1 (1,4-beta-N-acetylmuramidase)